DRWRPSTRSRPRHPAAPARPGPHGRRSPAARGDRHTAGLGPSSTDAGRGPGPPRGFRARPPPARSPRTAPAAPAPATAATNHRWPPASLVKGRCRRERREHPPPRPRGRRCPPRTHPPEPPPPRPRELMTNHLVDAFERIPVTPSPEETTRNGDESVEDPCVWRSGSVYRWHVWRNDR